MKSSFRELRKLSGCRRKASDIKSILNPYDGTLSVSGGPKIPQEGIEGTAKRFHYSLPCHDLA